MNTVNKQDVRIESIIGDSIEKDFKSAVDAFFHYLNENLTLPCEVTGTEDFRWEEYYILGPGDPEEHKRLRENKPSYKDHYDLLKLHRERASKWMLFPGADIVAFVRRKSDGKEFYLGLSELEGVDEESANYQLLDDYEVFFINYM